MADKEKNFVSAVIYVHNDSNHVENFLTMIRRTLEENFLNSEIICVDDASTDDSAKIIKKIGKEVSAGNVSVSIINLSFYHGVELAMNAGVDLAIGDFVFEFDSVVEDFDESVIMSTYRRSLEGYDIVNASPSGKNEISSRFFYYLFDKFSRIPYHMKTERFRILSRRVINRVSSMNKFIPYRKAIYGNCGFPTDTITYAPKTAEKFTRSDEEIAYRERLAIDALLLFTDVGYRLAMTVTGLMIFVALFTAIYALGMYFTSSPVAGWTTTILFLSTAFFCLFGMITLMVKYLQIIINLVFQRKRYNFESIEKLTK